MLTGVTPGGDPNDTEIVGDREDDAFFSLVFLVEQLIILRLFKDINRG